MMPNVAREDSLIELVKSYSNFQIVISKDKAEANIIDLAEISNRDLIAAIKNTKESIPVWIYSEKGNYLIQCHGKESKDYIIAVDENYTLYEWTNQLRKRLLDLFICILVLPFVPFTKHSAAFTLKSIGYVIGGGYSWVHIRGRAIFPISSQLEENYQRNYRLTTDFYHFFRSMFIS